MKGEDDRNVYADEEEYGEEGCDGVVAVVEQAGGSGRGGE